MYGRDCPCPDCQLIRDLRAADGQCDHVGTKRVTRTAHGYLEDAEAGTVETACVDCGSILESTPPAR